MLQKLTTNWRAARVVWHLKDGIEKEIAVWQVLLVCLAIFVSAILLGII